MGAHCVRRAKACTCNKTELLSSPLKLRDHVIMFNSQNGKLDAIALSSQPLQLPISFPKHALPPSFMILLVSYPLSSLIKTTPKLTSSVTMKRHEAMVPHDGDASATLR